MSTVEGLMNPVSIAAEAVDGLVEAVMELALKLPRERRMEWARRLQADTDQAAAEVHRVLGEAEVREAGWHEEPTPLPVPVVPAEMDGG